MADSLDAPLRLVLGDEELLVSRAVAEVVTAVRDADPETDVRELPAGELATGDLHDLLSPSLFGGRRVVVLRGAQEAKTDVIDALSGVRRRPDRRGRLVVVHPGGAKGKALVDGLRKAGAVVVECAKLDAAPRSGRRSSGPRSRRRAERSPPDAVAVLLDAVGNDLRELATACSQLVADTGGQDRRRRGRPLPPRPGRGHRLRGGRPGGRGRRGRGAGGAALGAARSVSPHVLIADALADGVRIDRPGRLGRAAATRTRWRARWGCRRGRSKRAQSQARGWTRGRSAARRCATVAG